MHGKIFTHPSTQSPYYRSSSSVSSHSLNPEENLEPKTPLQTYVPIIEPAPALIKQQQGESILVLHQGQILISADFVAKWRKRKLKKAAELCVSSSHSQNTKVCYISVASPMRAQIQTIQGRDFVRVELLRKHRDQNHNEIVQAYTKIKCALRDYIDQNLIQFTKIDGQDVVTHVEGDLRHTHGIRENMVLAEILDFSSAKKSGIRLENAQNGVVYRLMFKLDFTKELQQFQGSQVYVKIQSSSSKGVVIKDWDWKLWNLDMHLRCLVKSTPRSFVFGIVLGSVKILNDDFIMYSFLDILEKYGCSISHYMKGGKVKADAANKLTVLVQMPTEKEISEQKIIASELMKEVYDLFTPITNDYSMKFVTSEIAEVVTFTKMAALLYVANRMQGFPLEAYLERMQHTEDFDKVPSTRHFMAVMEVVDRDPSINFDANFQTEEERLAFARSATQYVSQLIHGAWVCDLVKQPAQSEVDRQELINGIEFLGQGIEQIMARGDDQSVKFLRELLLDGRTKAELEQDTSIYNKGAAKTWMECFRWKFNKAEKERNLSELKTTLKATWLETSQDHQHSVKEQTIRDYVEPAFEARVHCKSNGMPPVQPEWCQ